MDTNEIGNSNRKRRFITLFLLILILIGIIIGVYFWQNARLVSARREVLPPQVSIEHPSQGQQLVGGQFSYVSTVVGGKRPIQSLELWVDGQLVDVINDDSDEGATHLGRVFDFLVDQGPHVVIVRAIDTSGLIGQSLPVSFTGTEGPKPDEIFSSVFFTPETPIEHLVEIYQVDPEIIIDRNPDVFGEGSPGEGQILIPISPQTEEGSAGKPAQPASGPISATLAAGKICFPSQVIPAMTAYFQNTKTKAVVSIPIQANQTTYSVPLYPGTYIAYAWSPSMSLGGSYSKAVPCGLTVACTDHAPLPFTVLSGNTTTGIDICDWYHQSSVPAPPPAPGEPAPSPSGQVSIPAGIPMLSVDQLEPAGNKNSLPWAVFIPSSSPGAPTNLKADVKNCKVQLSWNSDPDNISEYQVWLSNQNGLLRLMASLRPPSDSTKDHWYEFSPSDAGAISVWVDAVNPVGGQSSNPASVTIPENCAPAGGENLEFKTLEVETAPGYDRIYVYLSLEGIPEQRLPSDDSVFIRAEDGRADISLTAQGEQKYILPIPKDEMLTVEGECWGWSGGALNQLSKFSEVISADKWSGGEGRLGNEQCSIGYHIQANYSSGKTYETFGGKASGIPAPFNVRVQREKNATEEGDDSDPWVYSWWFVREVLWQWKGDIKDISGFTILLNGTPIKTVPANERMTTIQLMGSPCGLNNQWTVIANGKNGKSPTSQPFTESFIKCNKYIKVIFGAVRWEKTCDHWPCHFDYAQCDTLETYFTLSVDNFAKSFYGGNVFMPLACGKHSIPNLLDSPNQAVFILPFHDGMTDIKISAKFWDYDLIGSNDYLGVSSFSLTWPSFEYGEKYLKDYGFSSSVGNLAQFWQGKTTTDSVKHAEFRFNILLYPNDDQYNP